MNRSTVADVPALLRLASLVERFLPVLDAEDALSDNERQQAAGFSAYAARLDEDEARAMRGQCARQALLCLRKLERLAEIS